MREPVEKIGASTPRASRGDPGLRELQEKIAKYSPRKQGWSLVASFKSVIIPVLPAQAGVILFEIKLESEEVRTPRASRGDPVNIFW